MKILVVVDMQNDFTYDALRNENGIKIIPNVKKKIEDAIDENVLIIFTRDTHFDDYMNTEEGKNLPVLHCIKDTKGWQIVDELKEYAEQNAACIVDKYTFGSRQLGELVNSYVASHPVDKIELVGLCTDICVISNALLVKAMPEVLNIPVYVDAACCAGVTPESHDNALAAMRTCQVHIENDGNEPWRDQ